MAGLTMEGELLRADIAARGYALIDHGISPDEIDEAIAAYAHFTDNFPDPLPETLNNMIQNPANLDELNYAADTQKEWHKYRTNFDQPNKPGGYTNRYRQAEVLQAYERKVFNKKTQEWIVPTEDPKEFFHFHPYGLERMQAMHDKYEWGPLPSEVAQLMNAWMGIHEKAFSTMAKVLYLVEETHPELTSRICTPQDLAGSPLRLNWYYLSCNPILAGIHTDKGVGTLQIAESHLGFRARKPGTSTPTLLEDYHASPATDRNMVLIARPAEKAIYFPAESLSQPGAYPDTNFVSLPHDVLRLADLNDRRRVFGLSCARWSIVAFSNSAAVGLLSKDQTHLGEMQYVSAEELAG